MNKELGREFEMAGVAESIVRNFEIVFRRKVSSKVSSLDAMLRITSESR